MLLIFILGLLFGSFLNVCISRIPKKESIVFPNSHCTSCNNYIKPYDLIPVLSYLFLGGKCRYCKAKVSIQYPLVELLTGVIFVILYNSFGLTIDFAKYAVLSCLLLVISFIDFKTQEIPDGLVIFGLITGLLSTMLVNFKQSILLGILGFLLGGGLFLLIAIVSNGSMGGGDIKLMAVLGLWLGWKYILMVTLFSFVIGSVASIILIALKIRGRKDYIPFGPFIAIASFIVILYGNQILSWYINSMIK